MSVPQPARLVTAAPSWLAVYVPHPPSSPFVTLPRRPSVHCGIVPCALPLRRCHRPFQRGQDVAGGAVNALYILPPLFIDPAGILLKEALFQRHM